jgi:hypothetical protein
MLINYTHFINYLNKLNGLHTDYYHYTNEIILYYSRTEYLKILFKFESNQMNLYFYKHLNQDSVFIGKYTNESFDKFDLENCIKKSKISWANKIFNKLIFVSDTYDLIGDWNLILYKNNY